MRDRKARRNGDDAEEPGSGQDAGQGPDTMVLRPVPSGTGKPPRSRRRRVLRGLALSTALLVVVCAGAAYAYYEHLNGNIRKGERSVGDSKIVKPKADPSGHSPLNILLLGSDSRNTDEDIKLGGHREGRGQPPLADVQMLLHISADRKHASLTSIPRDTRVDIPRCTDSKTGKVYPPVNTIINASLARGGPGCTLATWQNLTHVYIDHWIMVDFAGVVAMTDEIGGVDVCVKKPVWDRPTPAIPHGGSGLKLTTAGHHTIKGKQALQWLRTRDAFGSDLNRAKAQHMYLNSMMRSMKKQNLFGDPTRLTGLADTATKALKVSREIGTISDLYDLAMQFKNIPTDQIVTVTMPNVTDPQDSNHVIPRQGDAQHLFSMIQHDIPFDSHGSATSKGGGKSGKSTGTPSGPAARPDADIAMTVVNGTAGTGGGAAVPGRAGAVVRALAAKGFTKAVADPGQRPAQETALTYPKSAGAQGRSDALAAAKALGIPASTVKSSGSVQALTLVVGADWKDGTDYAESLPKGGSLPDGADAQNGSDDKSCMDVYPPYDDLTPR